MNAALFAIKTFVGFILIYFLIILSAAEGATVEEKQITLDQLIQGGLISLGLTVVITLAVAKLKGFKPRPDLVEHLNTL
ncbi:MAG TPA: hypothetical protein DHW71_08915 [Gammaproteobacteria bacterium]|nr:hypothetical protein [Gammaproteobacteria bacterium]HBF08919.1 hypothetical protein [Gammaproteobacteria bacterium]HCK93094.1 hypothetical protein [Gammaproteobacteria bacterium]|tara:strand:- start:712 stop:948 length:237 start_codon:yes stop_codon:yes gene_type:complete